MAQSWIKTLLLRGKASAPKRTIAMFWGKKNTLMFYGLGQQKCIVLSKETLYKYTWTVLQGWLKQKQATVVNIHNKH